MGPSVDICPAYDLAPNNFQVAEEAFELKCGGFPREFKSSVEAMGDGDDESSSNNSTSNRENSESAWEELTHDERWDAIFPASFTYQRYKSGQGMGFQVRIQAL